MIVYLISLYSSFKVYHKCKKGLKLPVLWTTY